MLYYLDSFSNVNMFSSASIHTIKQSFHVPSTVFFILLIKRTLQIFITTAEKRALVKLVSHHTKLYKLREAISTLVFNKSLPNLASLLIPAKTFFPAVLKDFRWLLVISKVWKTRGRIYLPCCTHSWGLKLCGHVLKRFLSKRCTSLQDIELELVRTFFIALWEGLTF